MATWQILGAIGLTACISSVSGQYQKELGDRKGINSRKNFLFKLIKHGSYINLTIGNYDIQMKSCHDGTKE